MEEEFHLNRMVVMGGVMGILGVGAAFILIRLIGFFLNLFWFKQIGFRLVDPFGSPYAGHWWTVILPVLGAVLVGLMLRYGSRVISGHGIPEAMEAVLYKESKMQARVAVLKPISAAIAIGSGGPFGAEGPIIMTGGAIGSLLGQVISASTAERKVMLGAGAAAGMVAIFGTPMAAVLLVMELLVFEFSTRAFIPVAMAAGIAMALRPPIMGEVGPLFPDVQIVLFKPEHILWYVAFGVIAGILAVAITWLLYRIEDVYEKIPGLSYATRPVLGGLIVGLVGLVFPRALGVGYANIAGLLSGRFDLSLIINILIWKSVSWSFSLGSGTSGGVLAPLLMIGGAAGALVGHVTQSYSGIPVGMVALVFMGALFGSSVKATIAAVLFAAEVTGHYEAMVPLLITCAMADLTAVKLLPYSIMTGKLLRRGRTVVQDYTVPLTGRSEAVPAHVD